MISRGMKATFANPYYNLSPTAQAHSLLPADHPDFSPNEACPPKLLFSAARRHHSRDRSASPGGSDDEDDDDDDDGGLVRAITPKRLTFAQEKDIVDKRDAEDPDPVHRAIGPVRATKRL